MVMDQLYEVLNIFRIQFPRTASECAPWFDYNTSALVELSNEEECASREANTLKDFTKTKDTLLVQADGGEFDEIFRLGIINTKCF